MGGSRRENRRGGGDSRRYTPYVDFFREHIGIDGRKLINLESTIEKRMYLGGKGTKIDTRNRKIRGK